MNNFKTSEWFTPSLRQVYWTVASLNERLVKTMLGQSDCGVLQGQLLT